MTVGEILIILNENQIKLFIEEPLKENNRNTTTCGRFSNKYTFLLSFWFRHIENETYCLIMDCILRIKAKN